MFRIVKDVSTFSLEEAIGKVLSDKKIDPHIKTETLKQFKIIQLTAEQQPFKNHIASLVLDKSPSNISAILEKVVV